MGHTLDFLDRTGLSTLKWEYEQEKYNDPSLLCFGTADMDFGCPQPILDSITEVVQKGHLGYPHIRGSYYEAIESWLARTTGWHIDARTCTATNVGVYTAVWTILDALTQPGDEVIIQTPVHFCFTQILCDNGRVPVVNPLKEENQAYRMDWEHLESLFTSKTKIFWLCNPHNPIGRAWTVEELHRLGEICLRNHVTILSDDIYCGLVFPGVSYTPIASLSPQLSQNTITCYAPSKSYNTTGIKFSYVVSENPEIIQKYNVSLAKLDLTYGINIFGLAITEAAYNHCDPWLQNLMQYIQGNYRFLCDFVRDRLPGASVAKTDATYFAWIDMRCLGIPTDQLSTIFQERAHIIINSGTSLGQGGEGHMRLNLACSQKTLQEGLLRLEKIYQLLR